MGDDDEDHVESRQDGGYLGAEEGDGYKDNDSDSNGNSDNHSVGDRSHSNYSHSNHSCSRPVESYSSESSKESQHCSTRVKLKGEEEFSEKSD